MAIQFQDIAAQLTKFPVIYYVYGGWIIAIVSIIYISIKKYASASNVASSSKKSKSGQKNKKESAPSAKKSTSANKRDAKPQQKKLQVSSTVVQKSEKPSNKLVSGDGEQKSSPNKKDKNNNVTKENKQQKPAKKNVNGQAGGVPVVKPLVANGTTSGPTKKNDQQLNGYKVQTQDGPWIKLVSRKERRERNLKLRSNAQPADQGTKEHKDEKYTPRTGPREPRTLRSAKKLQQRS